MGVDTVVDMVMAEDMEQVSEAVMGTEAASVVAMEAVVMNK